MVKNLKHKSSKLENKMPPSQPPTPAPRAEANNSHVVSQAASPIALDTFASTVPHGGYRHASRLALSQHDLPDVLSVDSPSASNVTYNRASKDVMDRSLPESPALDQYNYSREAQYMTHGYPPISSTPKSTCLDTLYKPSMSYKPVDIPPHLTTDLSHPVTYNERQSEASTNWPHYYPHLAPKSENEIGDSLYARYQQYQAERKAHDAELQRVTIERVHAARQRKYETIVAQTGEDARYIEAGRQILQEARESYKESQIGGENKLKAAEEYTEPFCRFMTENPTVWHAVSAFEDKLTRSGFKKLSERKTWNEELTKGGKYFISRNGSSLIAFTVGKSYKSGNGVAMVGGHVDALTARLKPVSNKPTAAGYVQLGVAPYAGGLNATWWDRDLGIGGRVVVKDSKTGKITTKLVKLGWPIARIPTLAPHFGVGMMGQSNMETQMIPIIGLDSSDVSSTAEGFTNLTLGEAGSFAATQPPKLLKAIAAELSITDHSSIINWELELYDTQPAQTLGLEREFISAGRIDDKVCSWAAIEGLLADAASSSSKDDGIIKLAGVFDDEEIGSQLRQGAKGNLLPSVIERITEAFAPSGLVSGANLLSQTYANSFLISADVTHAINPNFQASYLENHAPRLNVGLCIGADSNGHMTTDAVSTALLTRIAEKTSNKLQLFMIRNDSRSGGTIGPALSSMMGVRAIDAGIPQLSMHSIRATIGNLDPGLGVKIFAGFFENFEEVDAEFDPAMG